MESEEAYQENVNAVPVFDVQQELNQWQTHQIVAKNALGAARQRAQDHKGRLMMPRNACPSIGNGLG